MLDSSTDRRQWMPDSPGPQGETKTETCTGLLERFLELPPNLTESEQARYVKNTLLLETLRTSATAQSSSWKRLERLIVGSVRASHVECLASHIGFPAGSGGLDRDWTPSGTADELIVDRMKDELLGAVMLANAANNLDEALLKIYSVFDNERNEQELAIAARASALVDLNVEEIQPELLVGLLTITLGQQRLQAARRTLFAKVRKRFQEEFGADRTQRILTGLD